MHDEYGHLRESADAEARRGRSIAEEAVDARGRGLAPLTGIGSRGRGRAGCDAPYAPLSTLFCEMPEGHDGWHTSWSYDRPGVVTWAPSDHRAQHETDCDCWGCVFAARLSR
jgi:hypothetical protein